MKNDKPVGFIDASHPNRKYYECYHCGKPFWKPDAFRKIYCCRECQTAAKEESRPKRIKEARKIYHKTCEWCGKEYDTMISYQKYCCKDCTYQANLKQKRDEWAESFIPKTYICKECGSEFTTECGNKHSVFCCSSCAEKHERRVEHNTPRHRVYMKAYKRERERLIGKVNESDVDYDTLFQRDKGICQICGLPVHPQKGIDNNWDGTIDHVTPISLGGVHMLSNCQLAHRICNSIKLQSAEDFTIDWNEKSKENNYWRIKFDNYKRLMSA